MSKGKRWSSRFESKMRSHIDISSDTLYISYFSHVGTICKELKKSTRFKKLSVFYIIAKRCDNITSRIDRRESESRKYELKTSDINSCIRDYPCSDAIFFGEYESHIRKCQIWTTWPTHRTESWPEEYRRIIRSHHEEWIDRVMRWKCNNSETRSIFFTRKKRRLHTCNETRECRSRIDHSRLMKSWSTRWARSMFSWRPRRTTLSSWWSWRPRRPGTGSYWLRSPMSWCRYWSRGRTRGRWRGSEVYIITVTENMVHKKKNNAELNPPNGEPPRKINNVVLEKSWKYVAQKEYRYYEEHMNNSFYWNRIHERELVIWWAQRKVYISFFVSSETVIDLSI